MRAVLIAATSSSAAETAYGSTGLTANSTPASAGPATEPICQANALIATARGINAAGTILGAIELCAGPMNVRTAPCSAAIANSHGKVSSDNAVPTASASATSISRSVTSDTIARRSNRSASTPASGANRICGRNWASPNRPS